MDFIHLWSANLPSSPRRSRKSKVATLILSEACLVGIWFVFSLLTINNLVSDSIAQVQYRRSTTKANYFHKDTHKQITIHIEMLL